MAPVATLTKADIANFIVQYEQEDGQLAWAYYAGKAGAKAWCCVKALPEARRKVGDVNSVQSVRGAAPPLPTPLACVCTRAPLAAAAGARVGLSSFLTLLTLRQPLRNSVHAIATIVHHVGGIDGAVRVGRR